MTRRAACAAVALVLGGCTDPGLPTLWEATAVVSLPTQGFPIGSAPLRVGSTLLVGDPFSGDPAGLQLLAFDVDDLDACLGPEAAEAMVSLWSPLDTAYQSGTATMQPRAGVGPSDVFVGVPGGLGATTALAGGVFHFADHADLPPEFSGGTFLQGDVAQGAAGEQVGGLRDVTGDGVADWGATGRAGSDDAIVRVYDRPPTDGTGWESDIDGGPAARIMAAPDRPQTYGDQILGPGDVTGDGIDDLLVLAPMAAAAADVPAGTLAVHVFAGPVIGARSLADADAVLHVPMGRSAPQTNHPIVDANLGLDPDAVLQAAPNLGTTTAAFLVGVRRWYEDETEPTGRVFLVSEPVTESRALGATDAVLAGARPGDEFGTSFADVGDVDGDGHADLVVGASFAHDYRGAAYLFRGPFPAGETQASEAARVFTADVGSPCPAADDLWAIGDSVAALGQLDGDGYADFAVGVASADHGTGAHRRTYIFRGRPLE